MRRGQGKRSEERFGGILLLGQGMNCEEFVELNILVNFLGNLGDEDCRG